MVILELATPVKAISIKDLIVGIGSGEEKPFHIKHDQTVRSTISCKIKTDFPDREYTTTRKIIDGQKVLMVIRLK